MKILHTADWHIGQFKGPVSDGHNLRFEDTVNCLRHLVSQAKEELPDLVCVSGDIFHQEQVGPVRYSDEMVAATQVIQDLASYSKQVIVMRGTPNHDGGGQFEVLKKMFESTKNVSVVTTPTVIALNGINVACIPGFDKQEFRSKFPGLNTEEENNAWTSAISNLIMMLRAKCEEMDPSAKSILMAHYTVPGCNMESGQTAFFANFEPVIPRESLITADFDAVLLGHIHRPQQLDKNFEGGIKNVFYSGAINAMNFNDEGQKRGFYIHEFSGNDLKSRFIRTPYREFITIDWETEDIEEYIRDGKLYMYSIDVPEAINDAIVRLRYSCTSEQKKALNIPLLQKHLYELGAFYVAGIEATSTIELANRNLLCEESDPIVNLKKWMKEKGVHEATQTEALNLAEPIIQSALNQITKSGVHGAFTPVSISVKNYRNYKEESFNFADVSFCTINGENGAGKSSLFMDAISDCLFEETREGDSKAWIRGTEDARSGSIEFIFDIGQDRFRVVRTRMKSGRPTLNLSHLEDDGTWSNRSKEKIADTQAEIIKLLGMDSTTFKACALIMQDQYGVFLQARPADRMAILADLLGLGIYGTMESTAQHLLADKRKELAKEKDAIEIKEHLIKEKGNPEAEIVELKDRLNNITSAEDILKVQLQDQEAIYSKSKTLEEQIRAVGKERQQANDDLLTTNLAITKLEKEIQICKGYLDEKETIEEKYNELQTLKEQIGIVEKEKIKQDNAFAQLNDALENINRLKSIADESEIDNLNIDAKIDSLKPEDLSFINEQLAKLNEVEEALNEMAIKQDEARAIQDGFNASKAQIEISITENNTHITVLKKGLQNCIDQKEYMKSSGCVDLANAQCKFLERAKRDVSSIPDIEAQISDLEQKNAVLKEQIVDLTFDYESDLSKTGYSRMQQDKLKLEIQNLIPFKAKKEAAERAKLEIARLTERKASNDKTLSDCDENLKKYQNKAQELTETVSLLTESVKMLESLKTKENELEIYAEQRNRLPGYQMQYDTASERLTELTNRRDDLYRLITSKQNELSELNTEYLQLDHNLESKIEGTKSQLNDIASKRTDYNIQLGALNQKAQDLDDLQTSIASAKAVIDRISKVAAAYELLKQAFSQDGVPHQIVRNIIPHITAVGNNILGQMTGGTMGVEFKMERTVKGKDGDKATLDVLINEYGKTTLPYTSKSGGEKVKASLAVILALSEIKASAAGIQLGMLFIDEPPFLDGNGAQAYVDALEVIRDRYPAVKIMAITHDEAMKARFTQSVTVVKTEDGSKVIY